MARRNTAGKRPVGPAQAMEAPRPPDRDRIGVLEAIWLAAAVTVPSVVNPFATARYDTEKALLLRIWGLMAALVLGFRLAGAIGRRVTAALGRGPFPATAASRGGTRFLWAFSCVLAAWIGIHGVSASVALVPGQAWYGSFSRGGGLWSLLACSALLVAVAVDCRGRVRTERLLLAGVVGSVAPTVAGILQVAGVPLFTPPGGFPENRPWASFGNAIALGSYLVGVFPATAYFVWRLRKWERLPPLLLLLLQGILLYRSASRGPLLGLAMALGVGVLLAARRKGWRNVVVAGVFALVALVGVFVGGVRLAVRMEAVRQHARTGMLTRFNTVEVRVLLYRALTARMSDLEPLASPDGSQDRWSRWRPWIGYGPECLSEPLLSRLTPRFEAVEGFDRVPDSTHSQTMDVLGGTGYVGLGIHLLFLTMLLRAAGRALGFRMSTRQRWLAGLGLLACMAAGVATVVSLWGSFAWAIGFLLGAYLGILLALAVAVHPERKALGLPGPEGARGPEGGEGLAIVPVLMLIGLWAESQFGIPLVASSMQFHLAAGLVVALLRQETSKEGETPSGNPQAAPNPFGAWVAVAAMASGVLLLGSTADNVQGISHWGRLALVVLSRNQGWVFLAVAAATGIWGAGPVVRSKAVPWALAGTFLYGVWQIGELSLLRTAPLRSVSEIVAWGDRMQSFAWLRLLPLTFLPAVFVRSGWRGKGVATAAGLVAFLAGQSLFWPPLRTDILLGTAQRTADLGEPKAAMEVVERVLPDVTGQPHAAHLASQVRFLCARAARAAQGEEAVDAAWDRAIAWTRQAVANRPLLASLRGELGGVLETASRESRHPSRGRILARAADEAYACAVALAPGMNIHRRRLAALRLAVRKDFPACFAVLRDMLAVDPDNAVALTMLCRQEVHLGQNTGDPAAVLRHFRAAVLYGERALRSQSVAANHVDLAQTREDLTLLRDWFDLHGLVPPALPKLEVPVARHVPPRLPEEADHATLRRLARTGGIALAVALLLTPVFRKLARLTGFVDAPAARKVHVEPTPLLGGLAILLGVLAGAWWGTQGGLPEPYPHVLAVACGLALVGLVDDRRPLPWWLKLAAQILAAWLLWRAGVRVRLAWLPGWANQALTMLWLVGNTNAVNFLDNMNGLSAGLSALAAAGIAVLGILNEGWDIAMVAIAVVGACLGFLRYNHQWHATVFMGDTGSLFLGCVLASMALLLRFPANHNWVTWLCPILLLAVPVFDMTHVCLARLRRGKNPFSTPGKDHTSHLLARMGFQRHGAVLAIHAAVVGCGLAAGVVAYASPGIAYAVAGTVFAFAVFLILFFELRFGRGGTEDS